MCTKMRAHVFMHLLLQIHADAAKGSNDDVGTDAAIGCYIADRVRQALIGSVITHRYVRLRERAVQQPSRAQDSANHRIRPQGGAWLNSPEISSLPRRRESTGRALILLDERV